MITSERMRSLGLSVPRPDEDQEPEASECMTLTSRYSRFWTPAIGNWSSTN